MKRIIFLATVSILISCSSVNQTTSSESSIEILHNLINVRQGIFDGNVAENEALKIKVKPLVGLSWQQIYGTLGQPTYGCEAANVAGCTKGGDVIYSFYPPCDTCLGGGPELSLSFNRSSKCIRAGWVISE